MIFSHIPVFKYSFTKIAEPSHMHMSRIQTLYSGEMRFIDGPRLSFQVLLNLGII